jgi:hypothetical protein
MFTRSLLIAALALSSTTAIDAGADSMVPFKGTWHGVTVSADPTGFPVVSIVAEGKGQLTRLGRFTMVSPHTTDVFTGETIGDQIFTAANGDTLTAFCEGFPAFQPDGSVAGPLQCTFTAGTGRFAGVTGSYEFFLVATPRTDGGPGFETVATINGTMSSVGSNKR